MRTLPTDELREGMILAGNIYANSGDVVPVLYENAVLTNASISRLQQLGIPEVTVQELAPLSEILPFEPPAPPIPLVSERLKSDAIQSLEALFLHARVSDDDQNITTAVNVVMHLEVVVDQLVDTLMSDQRALININDLRSYDEYTYHHSLSVAVLTLAIANTMGFSREELTWAGRCAIMHDIGKTAIPLSIIQKPSKLTDDEFSLIKRHSSEGYSYLSKNGIGDEALWEGVLCHHEKLDGSGYPFGFSGKEIPFISRIISVADVYDALTSNRPYRRPMQPHEAIEYVMAGVGSAFDYDVVTAFMDKLELYPVGSFLELSNNRYCIVVNNQNALRPVVRLVENGKVLDLFRDTNCLSTVIHRVVPEYELRQIFHHTS